MTRATAAGGPCLVGDTGLLDGTRPRVGARVGVNRGGVLERFARERLAGAQIVTVDRNLELGGLLESGAVDAVVTDSFERSHLGVGERPVACEPEVDRKVLWVSPARAADLGPRVDAWLAAHEKEIDELRARWLGGPAPRSELDHLLDLLARRLAYAPAIAAWKRARDLPVDDPEREARVLEAARADARAAGLDADRTAALFALQIELGKRVQRQAEGSPAPELDLATQIRPELERLGRLVVASAASQAPIAPEALDAADWTPLRAWLDDEECARLRTALLDLRPDAGEGGERARFLDAMPEGPGVAERLEEIRRALQAAVDYPPIARLRGLEGVAWVRFEIDREGAARDVVLTRSSGHAVLDQAAQRTVGRAGKLPWVHGRIEVPIRFSLRGGQEG
jgi:chorismate mutase